MAVNWHQDSIHQKSLFVSIVLPVLNGARFIDTALNSLLAQSHEYFEILVLDGGSSDGTQNKVSHIAAKDQRIVLIEMPATSLVARLNEGLKRARAPIIARMDADDIALPSRIERQLEALRSNRKLVLLGTAVTIIDDNGKPMRIGKYPETDKALREALIETCPFAHPTTMFLKEAALTVGGYRPAFEGAEDHDLWLRLSRQGQIANLAEPLLCYRRHSNAMGAVLAEQQALASACASHDFVNQSSFNDLQGADWNSRLPVSLQEALRQIQQNDQKRTFDLNYHRSLFFSEALRSSEVQATLQVFMSRWPIKVALPAENQRYASIMVRVAMQLFRYKQYSQGFKVLLRLVYQMPKRAISAAIFR